MIGWGPAAWLGRTGVWLAAAGLLFNDHVLKGRAPGLLTGKLSDVFGMYLVPLAWMAMADMLLRLIGVRVRPVAARWMFFGFSALASVCLVVVKTTVTGAMAYGHLIGVLRAAIRLPMALLQGSDPWSGRPIDVVVDPTDLIALLALVPSALTARSVLRDRSRAAVTGGLPLRPGRAAGVRTVRSVRGCPVRGRPLR